jgi:hypothetical protein
MQNLHFLGQTLILFAKAVQFHRISFLTPLRFSRTKRLNLKPPRLQLCAWYSKLLGDTALGCPHLHKADQLHPLQNRPYMFFDIFPFGAPFMDRGKVPQCPGTGTKFIAAVYILQGTSILTVFRTTARLMQP